jgi:hypothetical protein
MGVLGWLLPLWLISPALGQAPDGPVQLVASPSPTTSVTDARQLRTIDFTDRAVEQRLRKDVAYLSSDQLEGRGLQTQGLDLAAEFVAREYAAAGLRTDHYQGTPFHEFKLYSAGVSGSVQTLTVEATGHDPEALMLGTDYTSLMVTAAKAFRLPVVFAGYGITDPERKYDDYAGIDARGKAVILLRHEPQLHRADSPFLGTELTDHAYVLTKLRNAHGHGAAAIILCTDAATLEAPGTDGPKGDAPHGDPLLETELTSGLGTESLPIIHCRRSLVDRWLSRSSGRKLVDIERAIDADLKPQSAALPGHTISGRVAVVRPGRTVRNVVGVLDGQGPLSHETIVVGAHYDHLGRGGWGSLAVGGTDEIHNGADDNASGTAVLLEAARQLAAIEQRRRRVVFIAFTAEELGLYGSKRYVLDPLYPLSQTVAMLNLDMVGRLERDQLTVFGTGTAKEWPGWLETAATKPALRIHPEPSGFGPSDHAPFYERGVPVLHFFTGFHPEYHRPGDDAERLNVAGMSRVTQLLVAMIRQLDAASARPQPSSVEQPFQLAMSKSINGVDAGDAVTPPPRLGVLLQETEDRRGVRIRQVQADGLAVRAGLQAGDILLSLGGMSVQDIDGLHRIMKSWDVDAALIVEFERGGIRREVDVLLRASSSPDRRVGR